MAQQRITEKYGEREELTVSHRGEQFILVPSPPGYELMTEDYIPVRYCYPASPKTGCAYSVGDIEYLKWGEGFYGRKSEGWKAPQLKSGAKESPQAAALALLGWLDRKAKAGR